MSYGVFADYYDLFTSNVDYKSYAARIDLVTRSLGLNRGSLVDLGCGTGKLAIELSKLGYDVTGVDLSIDMLTKATDNSYKSGTDIKFVRQDITRLSLPYKADVIVSTLDCINHLSGIEDVKKTFSAVKKSLSRNGVFIFDMNTIHKHKNVLSNNAFIFDSDEAYLGWQNDYDPTDNSVMITLDFFIPKENGRYERATEVFCEKAYKIGDILKALEECGLRAVKVSDGLTDELPVKTTERVLITVKHKR